MPLPAAASACGVAIPHGAPPMCHAWLPSAPLPAVRSRLGLGVWPIRLWQLGEPAAPAGVGGSARPLRRSKSCSALKAAGHGLDAVRPCGFGEWNGRPLALACRLGSGMPAFRLGERQDRRVGVQSPREPSRTVETRPVRPSPWIGAPRPDFPSTGLLVHPATQRAARPELLPAVCAPLAPPRSRSRACLVESRCCREPVRREASERAAARVGEAGS